MFGAIGRRYIQVLLARLYKGSVGVFIVERWVDSVVDVARVNERIMYVKLVIGKQIVNVVSAYAPQVRLSAEEKDDFWDSKLDPHCWVLGLTVDPKLTYSTHIHNISVQAHKSLQMINALTATGWGKQKETLLASYKAVMRPALEYACYIWSHFASSTSINKLQVVRNASLKTATGYTQDTNI